MNKFNLNYNSTYISSNLIDELDFIIGGYGKPNPTFLYTLNVFLESYILNSNFYISDQEFKHIQIVSKSMYPNGRPILELLTNSEKLCVVGGIGNPIGQVISIRKTEKTLPTTSYQEQILEFIQKGFDTNEVREKYLIIPSVNHENKNPKFISIGKVEDGFIATESSNSPIAFYSKLCDISTNNIIQAALPIYNYKQQITENRKVGIGQEILHKITKQFDIKQVQINNYLGYSLQNIPPLVNILLGQCLNIYEIPSKIIQLREDFTQLRESVIKYEKRINESNTIKEQFDAIDELNEFWSVFAKKYSGSNRLLYHFWEISKDSDFDKSIDNVIDSKDLSNIIDDVNLGKIAGRGMKKIYDIYNEKRVLNRFRGITDAWKLFENSPNVKQNLNQFEKIFGVNIEVNELQNMNKFLQSIKID